MDILCRILSGAITAVVIIAVVARSADATEVKLHERVVPKASVVRLGDIADIMAKDQQLAKRLAAVPLMPAPAPETEQFVRQREVADMLAANGVELGSIRFSGAKQVAVSAASNVQTVTFQERASAEIDAPTNRHAVILAGGKVVVAPAKPASISKEFTKPQLCRVVRDYLKVKSSITEIGKIDCNVTSGQLAQLADATSTPVCSGGSEPWTGRQRLTLSFATAAGPAQLTVYADVAEAALPMVVALRPVARGDVITAADIELRRLEPSAKTSGLRAPILIPSRN